MSDREEDWSELVRDNAALRARIAELEAALDHERTVIAEQARIWAGHYPQSSDGRNTFILLAEWIEARSVPQQRTDAGKP